MIPLPERYGKEILRCEVGSTLHGTGLPGHEDRDEMGIYIEHPGSVIGLGSADHWIHRTAGGNNPSTAADTDLVCYSARKWMNLALKGNPSVLLPLFAPDSAVVHITALGRTLRRQAPAWVASTKAGGAFLGYMQQQRQRMTGQRGKAGRVRTMPDGGVDWKYAMHMLRLGHQGVEFLLTGRITLPVPDHIGDHLRCVRRGEVPFDDVVAEAESLEDELKVLLDGKSTLPRTPNTEAAESWLIRSHLRVWNL